MQLEINWKDWRWYDRWSYWSHTDRDRPIRHVYEHTLVLGPFTWSWTSYDEGSRYRPDV